MESASPREFRTPRGEDAERTVGFLTDATLCIGCKACQVACKQWNSLPGFPGPEGRFEGGYDHTGSLSERDWRHVLFVETPAEGGGVRWSFLSDVCKHCTRAGCLDSCPTTAILRTELASVVVRDEVCNGCGYCVASCPFGVIGRAEEGGTAHKCTLCDDRLSSGLEPSCVKTCPTDAIVFGDVADLARQAKERVTRLAAQGNTRAHLWGEDRAGGLHALFILDGKPADYGLPEDPSLSDSPSQLWLRGDAMRSGLFCVLAVGLLLWGFSP
jgi:formate dehydrogenase iron-sulfur subunit